ncbi:hypothetical protein TRIUR3_21845 [Triticum urartu]|uniref:Uncharacterized protein n=2 Tax=Triticum urartu TaxID=4572 RepID=M8AGH3_TRIUA|nr:hypothetical protein TRIUR3_21845 [Triticum urartu]
MPTGSTDPINGISPGWRYGFSVATEILPPQRTLEQGKEKFLSGESSAAVMAAPFLSIRTGIGTPSRPEEEPPELAQGLAGKGEGGHRSQTARRRRAHREVDAQPARGKATAPPSEPPPQSSSRSKKRRRWWWRHKGEDRRKWGEERVARSAVASGRRRRRPDLACRWPLAPAAETDRRTACPLCNRKEKGNMRKEKRPGSRGGGRHRRRLDRTGVARSPGDRESVGSREDERRERKQWGR